MHCAAFCRKARNRRQALPGDRRLAGEESGRHESGTVTSRGPSLRRDRSRTGLPRRWSRDENWVAGPGVLPHALAVAAVRPAGGARRRIPRPRRALRRRADCGGRRDPLRRLLLLQGRPGALTQRLDMRARPPSVEEGSSWPRAWSRGHSRRQLSPPGQALRVAGRLRGPKLSPHRLPHGCEGESGVMACGVLGRAAGQPLA